METRTSTSYFVSEIGDSGYFSPEGYSKYNERWKLRNDNKLPEGEQVYGYEQALDHIEELKESVYEGKKHHANAKWQIIVETKIRTVIDMTQLADKSLDSKKQMVGELVEQVQNAELEKVENVVAELRKKQEERIHSRLSAIPTDTTNKPTIMKITAVINEPTALAGGSLTKEDVFGTWSTSPMKRIKLGMVVAQGSGERDEQARKLVMETTGVPDVCPVFGDKLPVKSHTVICAADQENAVTYQLEYVLGGNCVSKRKQLPDGKVALRADYQCW